MPLALAAGVNTQVADVGDRRPRRRRRPDAVEGQGAGRRQGRDDHRSEARWPGSHRRIGEAEVGGREGVAASSTVVTVLSVPAGASLTEVTLMVIVLALVEVDAAVGGAAVVLHLEGEARVGRAVGVGGRGEHQVAGSSMSATTIAGSDRTPLRVRVPAAGRVVMTTPAKALAGSSTGSVKPKSAAAKVWRRPRWW